MAPTSCVKECDQRGELLASDAQRMGGSNGHISRSHTVRRARLSHPPLRPASRRYKSVLCRTFVRTQGHCPYGQRCNFLHAFALPDKPTKPADGASAASNPERNLERAASLAAKALAAASAAVVPPPVPFTPATPAFYSVSVSSFGSGSGRGSGCGSNSVTTSGSSGSDGCASIGGGSSETPTRLALSPPLADKGGAARLTSTFGPTRAALAQRSHEVAAELRAAAAHLQMPPLPPPPPPPRLPPLPPPLPSQVPAPPPPPPRPPPPTHHLPQTSWGPGHLMRIQATQRLAPPPSAAPPKPAHTCLTTIKPPAGVPALPYRGAAAPPIELGAAVAVKPCTVGPPPLLRLPSPVVHPKSVSPPSIKGGGDGRAYAALAWGLTGENEGEWSTAEESTDEDEEVLARGEEGAMRVFVYLDLDNLD